MRVTPDPRLDQPNSRQALAIGMWLFLAALAMLFLAGILLYVLFRLHIFGNVQMTPVRLPHLTWLSTPALVAGSFCIQRALAAVKVERQAKMRFWLYATSAVALLFVLLQTPCVIELLRHYENVIAPALAQTTGKVKSVPLDGLVAVLIILHALHVIGGLIAMGIVTYQAHHGRYDHEQYIAVRHAALYWHFLDAVWVTMFVVFQLTS